MNKAQSKILIVEDEVIVAMEIEMQLQVNGYEVVGRANTSQKAIELAKEKKPDIILMDVNIRGDKDGIQTCEEILKYIDAHIVFVSAYNDVETRERMKVIVQHHFLPKPFTEREMVDLLEKLQ